MQSFLSTYIVPRTDNLICQMYGAECWVDRHTSAICCSVLSSMIVCYVTAHYQRILFGRASIWHLSKHIQLPTYEYSALYTHQQTVYIFFLVCTNVLSRPHAYILNRILFNSRLSLFTFKKIWWNLHHSTIFDCRVIHFQILWLDILM